MPPEKLPPSIRMSGIGNAHMEITATPEAQMWFDQGLNLLHDFWDYESARAFEQGVRVDPQCAMCYWDATEFIDHVSASNCSAGWTPPPVAPAGLNSKVQHAVQTWHVASSSTGLGVLVGSDTQTWYTDHATVQ
jgi:hypothetical protein